MTDLDRQLDDDLRRLGARIPVPAVPPVEDLARGRARLRRQRVAAGGAALATALVIGAAATGAHGLFAADSGPGYSGDRGTPAPAPQRSGSPTGPRTEAATDGSHEPQDVEVEPSRGPGLPDPPDPFRGGDSGGTMKTLAAWQQVLAEHLDPSWAHLVKLDAKTNGNVQSTSGAGGVTALGSKYGWKNAGESGLGMLQLSVQAGWGGLYWQCGDDGWRCRSAQGPDGEKARVATYDGGLAVAVEHGDGQVVVLTADSLFGNNSTVAVSGLGVTGKDLVRAAADERLSLPGGAPQLPPRIPVGLVDQVGREALLGDGETLTDVDHWGGAEPGMQGRWHVGGADRGELLWDATVRAGDEPDRPQCLAAQFSRCVLRTVDDQEVLIGTVRPKWGGGWQVLHNGAQYSTRVVFTPAGTDADADAGFPVDRAVRLVLDERLQPTG